MYGKEQEWNGGNELELPYSLRKRSRLKSNSHPSKCEKCDLNIAQRRGSV